MDRSIPLPVISPVATKLPLNVAVLLPPPEVRSPSIWVSGVFSSTLVEAFIVTVGDVIVIEVAASIVIVGAVSVIVGAAIVIAFGDTTLIPAGEKATY